MLVPNACYVLPPPPKMASFQYIQTLILPLDLLARIPVLMYGPKGICKNAGVQTSRSDCRISAIGTDPAACCAHLLSVIGLGQFCKAFWNLLAGERSYKNVIFIKSNVEASRKPHTKSFAMMGRHSRLNSIPSYTAQSLWFWWDYTGITEWSLIKK